jgi:rhodanese-related sulfurtransferase
MKNRVWALIAVIMGFFAWGCYQFAAKDTTPKMTKEELRPLVGDPNVVIIDVRLDDEWKKSESKIKGAVREDPEKTIKDWADKYPREKTLVFY